MAEDLREAARRRADWFYETQLRRLNLEEFRGVRPGVPDARLDLISEEQPGGDFGGGPSGRPKAPGRVYLDSQRPVWSKDDLDRRDAFASSLLGRAGDWLGSREPRRLAERLAALRSELEASAFTSVTDPPGALSPFPRVAPGMPDPGTGEGEHVASAIARAELAGRKPWLTPELYSTTEEARDPKGFVTALERYVAEFETELGVAVGGIGGMRPPFHPDAPAAYRAFLSALLTASSERPAGDAVKVRLVDLVKAKPEDDEASYRYLLSVATNGAAMGPASAYPLSTRVAYWAGVVNNPLRECVALKPNSDMGLCQLVRLLYKYGPLPSRLGDHPAWRTRTPPGDTFARFMAARAFDPVVAKDPELAGRLRAASTRLGLILEDSARQPRSPDPSWSPLAGEILKQGLLSYKFWLDERPRANDNERLNDVKAALGYGDEADREMEFWSENHYIMFAASEYLLGQLWEDDTFQPAGLFADPGDRTGAKTGAQRRARGRVRCLKWLNNRLSFGWMEFNSSGYYREHLWALLNLVDFALDEELRTKAAMAVDLMLFDVSRFLHRGANGAAGGRSQFKSKSHGFDNGLTDVVEILYGVKGVFAERNAQIGASFASSTYEVPEVLLEIGAHPPSHSFTDRSRVSVTFDEAAKHGITWSQKSETKDSLWQGFAPKRAQHYPHLSAVNEAITRTHEEYGALEDDTVFFWGMSAFYNKQVLRNTLHTVHRFGLEKAEAFGMMRTLIEYVLPIVRAPESAVLGFSLADLPGKALSLVTGGDGGDELDEEAADDLSLVLEGSTRTRANILTYRSPGAMLSSVQNFRYGQLNFQSSLQQATLDGAVNVFVTAGFGGLDISDLVAFGAGFLAGGIVFGPVGSVVGGILAANAEEDLEGTNPLNPSRDDGPEWWTGYWAVPRILQHGGATILLSEFHDVQDFLAETGSHAWFPKEGFDRVVERRTSAYDDANFALLDIGHIGAKGFWLFGRVRHSVPAESTAEPEEGYVGVFSNKRPQWLTKDDDPYADRLEEKGEDGIWRDPPDLFADRDWYVNGKNVWIVQVGSRSEFGSFEVFMDRVSSARVHVDDVGDLECTYDVPLPGGGSERLRLTNGDDPEFELNGAPMETDLYPRFENPFVRGGLVEWGQRAYCLEWNGRSLVHDFSDYGQPVRLVQPTLHGAADTVVALVIHLRTGDEEMEAFTVTTATVDIGCERLTTDQVVAAGPVPANTRHDAEWIFLDRRVRRAPDMTLVLMHRASDGDPSWEATYSVKALMGDWTLRDCSVPFGRVKASGDRRDAGARPFAVRLSRWAEWDAVLGAVHARRWLLARGPAATSGWLGHHDLFVVDRGGELWHKRARCGMRVGAWARVEPSGATPAWSGPVSWAAWSELSGRAVVLVVSGGRLLARVSDEAGRWPAGWTDVQPAVPGVLPLPEAVPIGPGSALTVLPGDGVWSQTADLCLSGSDGEVYVAPGWTPDEPVRWRRLRTPDFNLTPGTPVGVVGVLLVASSVQGELWWRHRDAEVPFGGAWQALEGPGFFVTGFSVCGTESDLLLAACGPAGQVALGQRHGAEPVRWVLPRAEDGWTPRAGVEAAWASPESGAFWAIFAGADGTVRSASFDDPLWRQVGAGPGPVKGGGGRVAAASRVTGQVEVLADTGDGLLGWTWWS